MLGCSGQTRLALILELTNLAETLTPNYGWTKPDPGASANVWGTEINSDLDKIDAQVFANQQAGVPIGCMSMWPGLVATVPENWLPLVGQSLDTTTFASLFAIFGYGYGGSGANFNLPNMKTRFPLGSDGTTALNTTGGESTHTLTPSEMPNHTHGVFDPTHAHGVSQSPHAHPDFGHSHGYIDPGHAHSGVVRFGPGSFSLGVNNPQIQAGNTDNDGIGITIVASLANMGVANANIGIAGSGTGIGIGAAGGGAPHNNLPPYIQILYIIKYQ